MTKEAFLVTILIFGFTSFISAAIVTVKQDGTGDYTTIEAGMNESVWNVGDTVLVWPGIYYEHVYYYGNHITLASLYAIDPNPSYIKNTIIDGGQFAGCCVNMKNGNDDLIINGFTIRNGSGTYGGGIYISEATGIVQNCIIEFNTASLYGGGICIDDAIGDVSNCIINNNTSSMGGGIYTTHGFLYISGTTIKLNHARGSGGGIFCGYESQIQFDPDNKCNLYLNYGAPGTDYFKFYDVPPQLIVVDTFTANNPGTFFIASYNMDGYPVNEVAIQWDHAYLEPVDHDLFVNPVSGNDSNSGLNINEPLKTIAYASILIKSDSLNPHSIYLSNAIYSPSQSNEKLPFCFKSYISLIGESMDSTIINADSLSHFIMGLGVKKNFSMENITFQDGMGGIHLFNNDLVSINNITFKNGIYSSMGLQFYNLDSLIIKNTTVKNLKGDFALSIGCWYGSNTSFRIENCVIEHNVPSANTAWPPLRGGGIEIIGQSQLYPSELGHGILSNVQITDNVRRFEPELPMDKTVALNISGYYKIDLVNSTIASNILNGPNGPVTGFETSVSSSAELNIYNSNLYGYTVKELLLGNASTCRVYYSDIKEGEEGVVNWSGINALVWGSGNIDSNPLWDTTAAIPYAPPWNSPCVNTGTPMYEFGMSPPYIIQEDTLFKLITFDYDTIVLPQTDLAGNPRIVGGRIDMGAYECQDTTTEVTNAKYQTTKLKVEVYPNPFYANTFISLELYEKTDLQMIIYDLKGNEVKRLMDASLPSGNYNLTWEGDDNTGIKVENGIYLVTVYSKGIKQATEKIIKNSLR